MVVLSVREITSHTKTATPIPAHDQLARVVAALIGIARHVTVTHRAAPITMGSALTAAIPSAATTITTTTTIMTITTPTTMTTITTIV